MNNTFQIAKNTSTTSAISQENLNTNDKASFKESITGIEKYWTDLNSSLDKKIKDREELKRMLSEYQNDEFNYLVDIITIEIEKLREKLNMIQRIMWDVRTRILFSQF